MAAARTGMAGGPVGGEDPGRASAGGGRSGGVEESALPSVFRQAVASLEVSPHRPEVRFTPLPAPKRLAPYAYALEAVVEDGGEELADGRFVLLYDPAGQEPWEGDFRIVTLGRTGLEAEMAADPLLPEVTWTWLTGALDSHRVEYAAPSGTVTRSGSSFFGGLADREPQADLEIRASWTPRAPLLPHEVPDAGAHLVAWCELLCQCAGLPPGESDGGAVVSLPQRRGPRPA